MEYKKTVSKLGTKQPNSRLMIRLKKMSERLKLKRNKFLAQKSTEKSEHGFPI